MDLRLQFITTPPPKLLILVVLFIRDGKVSGQTHNSVCRGICLCYFEEAYTITKVINGCVEFSKRMISI